MAVKVFFSYSHDSAPHMARVLALSNRLRDYGVDAELDQYVESPTEGWPRWCANKIEEADYVLVVCTGEYEGRFKGGKEAGSGRGAKWEGALLTQHLYDAELDASKFIPMVFSPEDVRHVPTVLRGATVYDLHSPDGFEKLYRRLTKQPGLIAPPLGHVKTLPSRDLPPEFKNWNLEGAESGAAAAPRPPAAPAPIRKYLDAYPEFDVRQDTEQSYVRTSPESFFYAMRMMLESLAEGQEVWSTDNINLSQVFIRYWFEEGLEYLKMNFEAARRGVRLSRVFIVTAEEYRRRREAIGEIGKIHAMTGVNVNVAIYEDLPPQCRYDFALIADTYVDEVVYDIRSNGIVDNRIHWSERVLKQFSNKRHLIENLLEPDWAHGVSPAVTFDVVRGEARAAKRRVVEAPVG